MADTRITELRKEQDATQARVSGLMDRLKVITIQIKEMQEQSSQRWKGVQTQLGALWKRTPGWPELDERKDQAKVRREDPRVTHESGVIREDNGKSLPKLEFPDFDGSNLEEWVYRSGRYFDREQTPEVRKVRIASVHMYEEAFQWHYAFIRSRGRSDLFLWKEYVEALTKRFCKAGNRFMVNNLKREGENNNSNVYMEEFGSRRRKGLERAEWSEDVQISLAINDLEEYTTQLPGVQSKARLLPNATQSDQVQGEADVTIGSTRGFSHSIAPSPNVRVHTCRENLLARSHGEPSHAPRHDEGGGLSQKECNKRKTKGLFVQTAGVDFYWEFSEVGSARKLINEMLVRDVFAWSTLISAYSLVGDMVSARCLFYRLLKRNITTCNSLIEGNSWMSEGEMAESMFESMTKRDVISWAKMITCYSHNISYGEALAWFEEITSRKIKPDKVSLTTVLSACAPLNTLVVGRETHCYLMQNQLRAGVYTGSVMVDMYAKYENLATPMWVFYRLQEMNMFYWNSTIEGFAMHSHAKQVLMVFDKMEKAKVKPNGVTFISISSACSLARLVEEGRIRFQSMTKDYLIYPEIKRYGCRVNLLSKAGLLEEAWSMVNSMTSPPNLVIWGALLTGCKIHKNLDIAWIAVNTQKDLEPNNNGHHALLISIYAESNRLRRSAQDQTRVSAHVPLLDMEMTDNMEGADRNEICDFAAEIDVEADDSGHLRVLAVLYTNKGWSSNALAIWLVLARNFRSLLRETGSRDEHQSRSYTLTGGEIAATEASKILQACSDQNLVMQHFGWISDINQILAVNILTLGKREKQLSHADVLAAIDSKKVDT